MNLALGLTEDICYFSKVVADSHFLNSISHGEVAGESHLSASLGLSYQITGGLFGTTISFSAWKAVMLSGGEHVLTLKATKEDPITHGKWPANKMPKSPRGKRHGPVDAPRRRKMLSTRQIRVATGVSVG